MKRLKYLLDTDTVLYILNGEYKALENFSLISDKQYAISIMTHSEVSVGLNYQDKRSKEFKNTTGFLNDSRILEYGIEESNLFGKLKARLSKQGNKIQDMDTMIAATVMINNLTLVTNNTKHYSRIEGLKLDNWMA